jgi:branched-chain amino acid transport system ATP-binding protein
MALLEVDAVTVRFGGVVALNKASFSVATGEICGLIGPNGAGKTTLFNCVSRLAPVDEGAIRYDGRNLLAIPAHGIAAAGISRTFQNLGLVPSMSVLENVMLGAYARTRSGFLRQTLGVRGVREEERAVRADAMGALERLRIAGLSEHLATGLPYGTLKRIELARALAAQPRLLLLDEPASGLTHEEVGELGSMVKKLRDELGLTVLLVEHHMNMVMGISDTVVALEFGQKLAEGTPDEVRNNPAVIAAYLGTAA